MNSDSMFLSDKVSTHLVTFALLPQIVAAVQVGTAYLCCPEATTSPLHRAALLSTAARHTALTNLFSGRPARSIVNRVMRELGPLCPAAPAFPLATAAIAPLRAAAEKAGSSDFTPLWCGENASACREVPAAELTRQLAAGWSLQPDRLRPAV